jgi:uncharacterized protein YfbU (UPF0304 family)
MEDILTSGRWIFFVDHIQRNYRGKSTLSVDELTDSLENEPHTRGRFDRNAHLVPFLRRLEDLGVGTFRTGRRGASTRLEVKRPGQPIPFTAAQDGSSPRSPTAGESSGGDRLTRAQRWMISNQIKILAALEEAGGDEEWVQDRDLKALERRRKAVEQGYELDYWPFGLLADDEVMTAAQCREVRDILFLFRVLKRSYEEIEDKRGIDESRVEFMGFDGNNEAGYLAYARFFLDSEDGNYEELHRGDDVNSHHPVLPTYRRRLARWRDLNSPFHLGKAMLLRVIAD